MLVLGVESSCDETGVALYDSVHGLLAHALYSQIAMHAEYGGVVPELASRDHIRRVLPLTRQVMAESGRSLAELDGIAYTQGPGLAGALLVGAGMARALAFALGIPAVGVHHLEGHLLSPLLAEPRPDFPFLALLVSGGHTQIMAVRGVGQYEILGETLDDAAGEAFDKTAKLLGLPYPGGPLLSRLAEEGDPARFELPRPMLHSANLDMSFSGLKTAVLMLSKQVEAEHGSIDEQARKDICRAFQEAIVEVLVSKCIKALKQTGMQRIVVAGGVGANKQLRAALDDATRRRQYQVFYPPLKLCTDNGAMIAFAGAMRLKYATPAGGFTVKPRWELSSLPAV
jgi:N6-L-threonylcarbamoyladenine synthase